MMKGMATLGVVGGAVGGVALSGLAAGATAATVLNATVLKNVKDNAGRPDIGNEIKEENAARAIGRASSFAGAASGAAATVGIISAAGIPGLSAVGITSGLAAIGSTVTLGVGGMATGIVIGVAAPAVVAVAAGIGAHKLAQNNETVREGLTKAGDVIGATSDLAKRGLQSFLGSVEAGAAALKKKLDGSDQD